MNDNHVSILVIALPTPLRRLFDYLPVPTIDVSHLVPGIRVRVPFRSRTLVGILIAVKNHSQLSHTKLKTALEYLDDRAVLSQEMMQLCQWAADYYHASVGEMLSLALPALLRRGKPLLEYKSILSQEQGRELWLTLNEAQEQAFARIMQSLHQFNVFLLDGVTGSGKTEVYLHLVNEVLAAGKQVLVLVPEIGLTPQLLARFRARFSVSIAAWHSGLSDKARLLVWQGVHTGVIKVLIGTRSAVFSPLHNLGLIIIDEEHDQSFKQQERIRYHARDLAIKRASQINVPIVLGSATPSLESLLNVKRERYQSIVLPERAGQAMLPNVQMVNVKQDKMEQGLSVTLLAKMKNHLQAGNQVLLFLNRRGFSPVWYCSHCAWIALCSRCDVPMVYHRKMNSLRCHRCDQKAHAPNCCESCNEQSMLAVGLGTQRLEEALAGIFPDIPLFRIDRDSTQKKNELEQILQKIHDAGPAILLGTQMLAKGHHFSKVTLVGVIDVDAGLFSIDFRATEKLGQMIMQVAGRAGRVEQPGQVILQTAYPDHPLLIELIRHGYSSFAQILLQQRELSSLPPYTYAAILRAESYLSEEVANRFLEKVKQESHAFFVGVNFWGPVPAILAKKKGLYCAQLLIKANKRSILHQALVSIMQQIDKMRLARSVKWCLDVDPLEG